jgi:hypothetical protein
LFLNKENDYGRVYSANHEEGRLNHIMSAPTEGGLGETEPLADGSQQIEFTQNQKMNIYDETNLNDEESF